MYNSVKKEDTREGIPGVIINHWNTKQLLARLLIKSSHQVPSSHQLYIQISDTCTNLHCTYVMFICFKKSFSITVAFC